MYHTIFIALAWWFVIVVFFSVTSLFWETLGYFPSMVYDLCGMEKWTWLKRKPPKPLSAKRLAFNKWAGIIIGWYVVILVVGAILTR